MLIQAARQILNSVYYIFDVPSILRVTEHTDQVQHIFEWHSALDPSPSPNHRPCTDVSTQGSLSNGSAGCSICSGICSYSPYFITEANQKARWVITVWFGFSEDGHRWQDLWVAAGLMIVTVRQLWGGCWSCTWCLASSLPLNGWCCIESTVVLDVLRRNFNKPHLVDCWLDSGAAGETPCKHLRL